MFGSVMVRFQYFVTEKIGPEGWQSILTEAGLPPNKIYHNISYYPDEEFNHLLELTANKMHMSQTILYRDLGKDFGTYLISCYRMMFHAGWRTLDIVEKVAPKVFKISQLVDPKAPPAQVTSSRISPIDVVVHYKSPRKMCPYIMGIIDATAEYFNEKVKVAHVKCMLQNDDECEIHVKLLEANKPIFPVHQIISHDD